MLPHEFLFTNLLLAQPVAGITIITSYEAEGREGYSTTILPSDQEVMLSMEKDPKKTSPATPPKPFPVIVRVP